MLAIDDSLFSVLRVITIMLNVDGAVHAAELKWFRRLMGRLDLSPQQKEALEVDLVRPPQLDELAQQINFHDREQLRSWLRVAMNIDGQVSAKEKVFFDSVNSLLEPVEQNLQESHRLVATELLAHTRRVRNWQEIKEASDYFAQTRAFLWGFWVWPMRPPLFTNRYIRWSLFFFIFIPLVVNILLRLFR